MTDSSAPSNATAALCLATMIVTATPADAATPSFDCDGVRSPTERLICGDGELAALDMRLARNFARALARASAEDVTGLRADQRVWRARLQKCGSLASPRTCIVDAYEKRIHDLGTQNRPTK